MSDATEDKILQFIRTLKPEHRNIDRDTDLISGGVLNSLAVLQLVQFLSKQLSISIPVRELTPANLESAATIAKLVEKLRR